MKKALRTRKRYNAEKFMKSSLTDERRKKKKKKGTNLILREGSAI